MKFFTAFVAGASGKILEIYFFILKLLYDIFYKKYLAAKHTIDDCPTTKCWEIVDDKCSLKTSCNTLLNCTPENVAFL